MKWSTAAFVPIDKADQQRSFANTSMKFVQNLEGFRNKARFEDKVLGGYPVIASSGVTMSSAPAAAKRSYD